MEQTFKLVDMGNGEEVLKEIDFKDIKNGDILILRDSEGNLLRENGNCMFQAVSDSYLNKNGNYSISYCIYNIDSIYSR